MPKFVPFTAHVRVVPSRGTGKRFEYVRDLQKIATQVYGQLELEEDINIATPGGGQYQSFNGGGSGWGGMTNGTAVKPQIGEAPAQLMITGFLSSNDSNNPVHPDKPVIHTGTYQVGVGGNHGWLTGPITTNDGYVVSIKSKLETAVAAVLGDADWNIYRIDVAGVVYGNGGHHFPR